LKRQQPPRGQRDSENRHDPSCALHRADDVRRIRERDAPERLEEQAEKKSA
jgi:hypothetical protein